MSKGRKVRRCAAHAAIEASLQIAREQARAELAQTVHEEMEARRTRFLARREEKLRLAESMTLEEIVKYVIREVSTSAKLSNYVNNYQDTDIDGGQTYTREQALVLGTRDLAESELEWMGVNPRLGQVVTA